MKRPDRRRYEILTREKHEEKVHQKAISHEPRRSRRQIMAASADAASGQPISTWALGGRLGGRSGPGGRPHGLTSLCDNQELSLILLKINCVRTEETPIFRVLTQEPMSYHKDGWLAFPTEDAGGTSLRPAVGQSLHAPVGYILSVGAIPKFSSERT